MRSHSASLLALSFVALTHCVGDSVVATVDGGGGDASTSDSGGEGGGPDGSASDGGAAPTGAFASAVVLNDISIGSAATVAPSGEVVLGGSFSGTLNINNFGYPATGNSRRS